MNARQKDSNNRTNGNWLARFAGGTLVLAVAVLALFSLGSNLWAAGEDAPPVTPATTSVVLPFDAPSVTVARTRWLEKDLNDAHYRDSKSASETAVILIREKEWEPTEFASSTFAAA